MSASLFRKMIRKVLSLQPYYGGSHRQFIDRWIDSSRLNWNMWTLPARHWKWRMRHAAIEMAKQVDAGWRTQRRWDAIFTTDMLNIAEFKGLLTTPARDLPVIVYFHENQLAYPNQELLERDLHFGFTNLTSAMAADAVWFNSQYNLDSFVAELRKVSKIWPDYRPVDVIEQLMSKARIQPPGIEILEGFNQGNAGNITRRMPHLLWAARWEHDKNPEGLLNIVKQLCDGKRQFVASIIGEQYSKVPAAFSKIRSALNGRLKNWGYLVDRKSYWNALADADIYLSTADHEFFGIAAAEAVSAGCIPVLPNRLAYPELLNATEFPERRQFLYDSVDEAVKIVGKILDDQIDMVVTSALTNDLRERLCWRRRSGEMDTELEKICKGRH